MTSSALARSIAGDSEVEWAQVDRRRFVQAAPVNDPLYPDGQRSPRRRKARTRASGTCARRASTPAAATSCSSINIEPAWAITHGASSIVIGDVDTGITAHPDLSSKIFPAIFTGTTSTTPYGYDFIGYGETDAQDSADAVATANDGNLADPDPSDPGDYVTGTENADKNGPFYECNDADYPDNPPGSNLNIADSSWHGTQTASILAAATNNGVGMAGVGYDTMVVPARALGKCGGYDSDIIAAAEWAGGITVSGVPANVHPARVINMSLGGSGVCATDGLAYVDALTAVAQQGRGRRGRRRQ